MFARLVSIASAFVIVIAPTTRAQAARSTSFTPFAGAVIPTGTTADRLSTGYTIGGAWDYRAPRARTLGVRIEGSYSSLRAKVVTGGSLSSTELGVNLNGVLWAPLSAPGVFLPYLTGGLTLTRLEDRVRSGTIAYTGAKNASGFNVGAGAYVAIRDIPLRLDVRYKRVQTNGTTYQVIPVTIGLRL